MNFPPQSDKLSLLYLAVGQELNVPGGINLEDPISTTLTPHDGALAYDKTTGVLYIGFNGIWHVAPGGPVLCDVNVGCNLLLKDSTDIATGNIIKNGAPFVHNFPGSASFNTFVGEFSGNFTMSGTKNSGFGVNALHFDGTGSSNVAIGFQTLFFNIAGSDNVAIGTNALLSNLSDQSTAIGSGALQSITNGFNTAVGYNALNSTTTSVANTAMGWIAMQNNTLGEANTAILLYMII